MIIRETEQDRQNQREIMQSFCKLYPVLHTVEMPPLYCYDFKLYSGDELLWLVEVKRRNDLKRQFKEWWISKAKVDNAIKEAQRLNTHLMWLVKWNDVTGWTHVQPPYSIVYDGRKDREGTASDIEYQYAIPSKNFNLMMI